MVTEKNNDVEHDFFKDPLCLQLDGTWLKVGLIAHMWVSMRCSIGLHAVLCRLGPLPGIEVVGPTTGMLEPGADWFCCPFQCQFTSACFMSLLHAKSSTCCDRLTDASISASCLGP